MARWAQHTEFKRAAGRLSAASARDFEREALPFLRLLAPTLVAAPELGSFDRAGADFVSFGHDDRIRLVVQCKGFKVEDSELGRAQIDQCRDSIKAFRTSGVRAECYVIVHNRFGRDGPFKREILAELEVLRASGQVGRVELWDQSQLLKQVASELEERLVSTLKRLSAEGRVVGDRRRIDTGEPLRAVPYRMSRLSFDRHRLKTAESFAETTGDPGEILTDFDRGNFWLLLAEAGFGKTVWASRAVHAAGRAGFYFRAATLVGNPNSAAELIGQFTSIEELFSDLPADDIAVLAPLARPLMAALLTDPTTPAFIVIDGLDESIFLTRRGGLQWLFNCLLDVRIPVVLAARSEFWLKKRADFETSFGIEAVERGTRQVEKAAHLIELLPWTKTEIKALALRFKNTLPDGAARARIDTFIEAIDRDRYAEIYGDIPRRPLYLSYILETVAANGIHGVTRRELILEWARLKIQRDVVEPMRSGGRGRAPIVSDHEGVDATVELSFAAMTAAARLMSQVHHYQLELLPSCSEAELLSAVRPLERVTDTTGLVLHSLLLPVEKTRGQVESRLRFAHQIHHEVFLALHIERNRASFHGVALPSSVEAWLLAST